MTSTSTSTLPKVGTYSIDPAHTDVGFVARHLVGTKVRGRFTNVEGSFTVAENPADSILQATVQAESIFTGQLQRDEHLRTNDFLDVPNFPTLTLKSTGLRQVDDTNWVLTTDLTIRGVTKSVDFDLEFLGEGASMQEGKSVVAFQASATIDRRDFGVSFNHSLLDGSVVVGNKVVIEIETEAALAQVSPYGPDSGPAPRPPRFPAMPTHAGKLRARPATELRRVESTSPHVLAVDLGTGGPKVAVLAATGRIVAHAFQAVGIEFLIPTMGEPSSPRRRGGTPSWRRPAGRWPTLAWRPQMSSASAAPRSGRAPCPSTTPGPHLARPSPGWTPGEPAPSARRCAVRSTCRAIRRRSWPAGCAGPAASRACRAGTRWATSTSCASSAPTSTRRLPSSSSRSTTSTCASPD